MSEHTQILKIFEAAVSAVRPDALIPGTLQLNKEELRIGNEMIPRSSFNNVSVIGAGKATAAMAVETEKILQDLLSDGLVVTKYGHTLPTKRIKILEAGHPVPDENSLFAANETIDFLKKAAQEDIILCLLSGGASALWADLPHDINLPDLKETFDLLLKSGADISEMNTVRKHLGTIKGGQLVKYCNGARLITLVISDVPGNDISVIASGPTVPDSTTFNDSINVLEKYGLYNEIPAPIRHHLEKGKAGEIADTPKPGDPLFQHANSFIIGNNFMALKEAGKKANECGYQTFVSPGLLTGNTDAEARKLVRQLSEQKEEYPFCFISGGETTLHVTGKGRGGRNQHFALCALDELSKLTDQQQKRITILAAGTDGTDGNTDAAGAVIDSDLPETARAKGLRPEDFISRFDSWNFFNECRGLISTGPTQTNVMDIVIAIVG